MVIITNSIHLIQNKAKGRWEATVKWQESAPRHEIEALRRIGCDDGVMGAIRREMTRFVGRGLREIQATALQDLECLSL